MSYESNCIALSVVASHCDSDHVPCPGGGDQCIYKDWLCDGIIDCNDTSDEDPEVCQADGQSLIFNHVIINHSINQLVRNRVSSGHLRISEVYGLAHIRYWRFGSSSNALVSINKVALRWARLLLGWVTVCGQVNHVGM